jgi:pyridoxamine 5'-phosphate oxidase
MDPFEEFRARFALAEGVSRGQLPEPNAMVVSTVSADGSPSARVVLLKGLDERGFVFFTNLDSRKGAELAADPRCALVFHWAPIEWQVRVEGRAERVTDAEADAYFASRARESQIGAWASRQSETMASDLVLEERIREVEQRYAGQPVPRPPHWSGYRLLPDRIEFWHGRAHRLHERRVFDRTNGAWTLRRLFP